MEELERIRHRITDAVMERVAAKESPTPGPKRNRRSIQLRCSFCDKDQKAVAKLIAGPTVYICDGCGADGMALFASQLAG